MRYLITLFLLVLHIATGGAQAPASDVHGTWTAEIHSGKVNLQTRTAAPPDSNRSGDWTGEWSMGQTMPVDDLSGLANSDTFTLAGAKFELRREAGSFAFEGSFRDGRGAGLFTFAPRAAYTAEMKSLGYNDDLPVWRRYQLAIHDVGPKYIRDLKSEGYDKLTLDQVQRAKTHGVTIDYIRDLKGQGFKVATIEDLTRTRDHGVTGEFVKTMKAEGFTGATLEEFIRLRDHGVTQQYIQEMKKAGFSSASVEDMVRARDHGVKPDYVADIN
jgi:hypothetical protein